MKEPSFSAELESWLRSKGPKTIAGLDEIFDEKSFAIAFLLLMMLPALPLPTGGITTIFELITILLSLELILGRKNIWLPKRLKHRTIPDALRTKGLPFVVRRVASIEKFSRPRFKGIITHRHFGHIFGFLVLIFTLGSFVAPPFSGLDTLPALGVVLLSLSVVFEDIAVFALGILVGTIGIVLELTLGAAAIKGFFHFF